MFNRDVYKKYSKIVRRIKLCNILLYVAIVISLFTTAFCSEPFITNVNTAIKWGLSLPLAFLIAVIIFLVALIAAAFINMPIINALYDDCDPEKCFVLSEKLLRRSQRTVYITQAFFWMGEFTHSMNYLNSLINKGKKVKNPDLIFQKARLEFFMNDYESLKKTIECFHQYRVSLKNVTKRQDSALNKYSIALQLFSAIANDDREKIGLLGKALEPWDNFKITKGLVAYLKGIAAHLTDDKFEAIYQLSYVIKEFDKTFIAPIAKDIISSYDNVNKEK